MREVMKKILIGLLVLMVLATGLFQLSKSREYQLFGKLVNRVDTNEKVIALTFDDGPLPEATEQIIHLLAAENIRATFFVTGNAIELHPDSAKSLIAAGHQIGNHSYSHQRMVLMGYDTVAAEIDKTNQLIRNLGYHEDIVFRPPYGKKLFTLPYYLSQKNITSITWDVEPESYPDIAADSQQIAQHVVDNVRPGSIILLHVMFKSREPSMLAVPAIVQRLKADGYRFVTVNELLNIH